MNPALYIPIYRAIPGAESYEFRWVKQAVGLDVPLTFHYHPGDTFNLQRNVGGPGLREALNVATSWPRPLSGIIAEGFGGMFWVVLSRILGEHVPAVVLPFTNPHNIYEMAIARLHALLSHPGDVVLVGSRTSAELLTRFGLRAECHQLLGYDDARIRMPRESRATILDRLGLPDAVYLVYAGRLEPDKRIETLLSVFFRVRLQHPNTILLLVVHALDDAYRRQLTPFLQASLGVRVITSPAAEDLCRYYSLGTLFVSAATSFYETFGRAIVEAMACGLPPVVPRFDGFRDTVVPRTGVLVRVRRVKGLPEVDESDFVRKLDYLLSRPEAIEKLRRSCPRHAEQFRRSKTLLWLRPHLRRTLSSRTPRQVSADRRFDVGSLPRPIQGVLSWLSGLSVGQVAERLLRPIPFYPVERADILRYLRYAYARF